jgi:hypothetical protein
MLIANPAGHYHFLKGIDPYSSGVVADPGFEIVHVILRDTPAWRVGFERIAAHLASEGLDRAALCAVQLRCPKPYSIDGFIGFNKEYRGVIAEWDLLIDDLNPVARTNVAPSYAPPSEARMFAFSYTTRAADRDLPLSLVIAGAGELRDGVLEPDSIVRRGDTSDDAMRDKASLVMKVMEERLDGLGARWDLLNQINVYTVHSLSGFVEDVVLNRLGPARRMGIHWHHARPPVEEIEFEMDMRGVHRELVL